ncbi:hypothetical protein MSAN_01635300 [Mycena sanguinolenta]|uniref:Uncharacterized protein n=1 Tax=Mycena sanguinolenta TaxID=230812 RepID=A0A8H7CWG6_9AGAR|nr:hypothetical protein MSAN_01635300 [Mycena sanguinolenta]
MPPMPPGRDIPRPFTAPPRGDIYGVQVPPPPPPHPFHPVPVPTHFLPGRMQPPYPMPQGHSPPQQMPPPMQMHHPQPQPVPMHAPPPQPMAHHSRSRSSSFAPGPPPQHNRSRSYSQAQLPPQQQQPLRANSYPHPSPAAAVQGQKGWVFHPGYTVQQPPPQSGYPNPNSSGNVSPTYAHPALFQQNQPPGAFADAWPDAGAGEGRVAVEARVWIRDAQKGAE